ncbi:MAG: hypothetical protein COZ06_25775 [Armatimonadetes bacterium CG_4_10_14_3_um_filter_66_18]|nr:hypothetical protein [Armatimonadota bacterium]OIP10478.1 MAG: hypothetical protein AUJ96_03805 [Armatimonadetes bacterium CG2_30_66_41]PIU94892.1 MAG: hypothetical protein COS65_05270 [Armatimonadetes bacterium CG06_land_8_20_14_3_00_66_21]PIW13345.1 MAG: hypothetical protein COW34_10080 [Armatimonadetes bacterium CG17_big_fil_post_rev_8_21_14_2_50_66_6]PIX46228.1 MAG: hypothetical protein COZ57_13135 [Armatimonadetes bacterium CG_4_8_14_3_um_filter_66_20]PIY42167.1 MAG: hypothetical prote
MPEPETLEAQHVVLIRDDWLQRAGLGRHLQVEVLPGEIRLSPGRAETQTGEPTEAGLEALRRLGENAPQREAADPSPQPEFKVGSERGWAIWRRLGEGAGPGKYGDMAGNHDKYLYGEKQ